VISNDATVGIYNFSRGADFVAAADAMISADLRVNGEFYVAPSYNLMIERGARDRQCYHRPDRRRDAWPRTPAISRRFSGARFSGGSPLAKANSVPAGNDISVIVQGRFTVHRTIRGSNS